MTEQDKLTAKICFNVTEEMYEQTKKFPREYNLSEDLRIALGKLILKRK